jgi:hypothetical protein
MLTTAEFVFKYGCQDASPHAGPFRKVDKTLTLSKKDKALSIGGKGRQGQGEGHEVWPRDHSVLLQYSSNGGITWDLLKEIHYPDTSQAR